MTTNEARALVKAINRRVRRHDYFAGGRQYGVDYATWRVCYPKMAAAFQAAAEVLAGRTGRFMPRFN